MRINLKSIFSIVLVSSVIGIAYNYFSPSGIPLIPEEKKMKWADDSLFNNSVKDIESTEKFKKEKEIVNSEKAEGNYPHGDKKKIEQIEETVNETELTEPSAVDLNQAFNLYKKNVLFIDAREPADFNIAHIKNAVNIPFDHFDEYEYLLINIDKKKIIVTYCAGTDCDLSILLANKLFELGYKNVYIFFGGWNDWLKAEYPTDEGVL